MADTHVHAEPAHGTTTDSFGFFLGMILLIAFVFFLFFYGLPVIRNMGTQPQAPIQEQAPKQENAPQINVPEKLNIDVNK